MKTDNHRAVEKLRTGISSLDIIAKGGLPKKRTTLISGTAGSGKTVFATQFLAAGIANGEPGVFVTFEESAADIRANMRSFGWDLAQNHHVVGDELLDAESCDWTMILRALSGENSRNSHRLEPCRDAE
jgi:KaiC/GvpD/RAD55 family RecA-like ATPase